MNDIQKAIDQSQKSHMLGNLCVFKPEQLKSLLEQVAEEAFYDGLKKSVDFTEESMETWWNEQNLTFNEE